jgi:hypothetical protein
VVPAELRRRLPAVALAASTLLAPHERTQPGVDGEYVIPTRRAGQVARGVPQHELDLPIQRGRLHGRRREGRVGGAHQRATLPGDDEDHAAIVGPGDHDRGVAGQEIPREHQVDTLTDRDHRRHARVVHPGHRVGEHAGRVHHHPRPHRPLPAALGINDNRARDAPALLHQGGGGRVIEQRRPVRVGRPRQADRQPRIVELRVAVDHPAPQALRRDRGHQAARGGGADQPCAGEPESAGKQVVERQAGAIPGQVPPAVGRDEEA